MASVDICRRDFLRYGSLCTVNAGAVHLLSGRAEAQQASSSEAITWHDVRDWDVEGKGWGAAESERYFDRLPKRAKGHVRDAVWNLSRHSAGMLARFQTDATEIWVDYEVMSPKLSMTHMPATGVSGIDLYATDPQGAWRWLAVTRPEEKRTTTRLIHSLAAESHDFAAYLPLYNGTEFLKIGVPSEAKFQPIPPRRDKPIVFYGTSITHGACASRPGMPHPAILGRRLNRPTINLGFSGNGKMEREVGDFLCELEPACYVIDCLPNMIGKEVGQRTEPLVRQLREARPTTPILLVEDRTYAHAPFVPSLLERHKKSRDALRSAYDALIADGFDKLGYVAGDSLLGEDRDDTTDGSHPNDLGFYRQANALEGPLRELLA